jgi:TolB-like protein/DNA-binding winged helix-turn-helix (wHTH) protein/lipoprotein NlpI
MPAETKHFYEFGPFRLDAPNRLLYRGDDLVPLPRKTIDTLLVLIQNRDRVLERAELMRMLWPDTAVEESNLTVHIANLRKTLETGYADNCIETLPRRGYRFVAPVSEVQVNGPAAGPPAPPVPGWRRRPTRTVAIVSTALLALTATVFVWFLRPERRIEVRSLAVLPLENLSHNPSEDYFADGMTEALITDLAQVKALQVISRTSVMQYKGARRPLPEIAQKLKVDAIVEGSVQRSGDRVRIAVQLVHAATDRHLWAKSYERDLRDILALESEVARAIVQEIKIKLTTEEQTRLTRARPVPRGAYDAYLKGRYFWWNKPTDGGITKSIEYFQQAIERDPDYALAYAGLADAFIRLDAAGRWPPSELRPKAKNAAVKAVTLDGTLAEVQTALGEVKVAYEWDWSGAETAFQHAIALNPRYAHAHFWYGNLLTAMGRREAAIAELKGAQDLDPLSLWVNYTLALTLYYAGQYDRAIEQARQVIEMDPNFWGAHHDLGRAYEQKGMYEEAVIEFQKAINISKIPRAISSLGHAYAASGRRKEAHKLIHELKELSQQQYVSPYFIATIYAGLGDKDQAFEWLSKAYVGRARHLMWLKADPRFGSLHSDPRFADRLRRIGLPP